MIPFLPILFSSQLKKWVLPNGTFSCIPNTSYNAQTGCKAQPVPDIKISVRLSPYQPAPPCSLPPPPCSPSPPPCSPPPPRLPG